MPLLAPSIFADKQLEAASILQLVVRMPSLSLPTPIFAGKQLE